MRFTQMPHVKSEVYFINKTVQMSLKWGTPDKIRFIDPLTSVPLEIGASGELNLQVSDARRLIVKLVGTQNGIAWDDPENPKRWMIDPEAAKVVKYTRITPKVS